MRVLVNSTCAAPLGTGRYGGIEKAELDFIKGLLSEGAEVTVAAPIGSKLPSGVELIKTVRLPEEFDREDIAMDRISEHILRDYTAGSKAIWDIVHDFSHKHLLGLQGRQIPAVFMLWNPVYIKYPVSLYNIMCCSKWQQDRFEAMYQQKALHGQFWVDTDFYKSGSEPRSDRFLFLGKLSPEKGVDLAIEYAKELGVQLDVVGGLLDREAQNNGYLERLNSMCDGEDIQLHFNVSEDEKLRFLQTAKAMIYPVRQDEAHCLAMIEAWVSGCPVVVADKGAMREISYEKNFVCPDKETFLKKMKEVSLYRAERTRVKALQDYRLDNVVPQWMSLYEDVIRGLRVA
jgi:glycosyltransferase involved in cell wall biosynthesis